MTSVSPLISSLLTFLAHKYIQTLLSFPSNQSSRMFLIHQIEIISPEKFLNPKSGSAAKVLCFFFVIPDTFPAWAIGRKGGWCHLHRGLYKPTKQNQFRNILTLSITTGWLTITSYGSMFSVRSGVKTNSTKIQESEKRNGERKLVLCDRPHTHKLTQAIGNGELRWISWLASCARQRDAFIY